MAEISYFFDNDDVNVKEYLSKDFANMIEILAGRGDGYIKGYYNELQVTANGTLNITIGTGAAIVNGRIYINDTPKILQVTQGGTYQYRVMLKLDLTTKKIEATLRGGTVAPSPMMDKKANVYEISIAKIMYRGGTTILQTDIIDERNDNTVCGRLNPLSHQVPSLVPVRKSNVLSITSTTPTVIVNDITGYNILFLTIFGTYGGCMYMTIPIADIVGNTYPHFYNGSGHVQFSIVKDSNTISIGKKNTSDQTFSVSAYVI